MCAIAATGIGSLFLLLAVTTALADGNCRNFQRTVSGPSTVVDLSLNNFPVLRARCLAGFRRVEFLHLKNCKIEEVEHDAFRSMVHLKNLDLSNNFLEYLPETLFEHNKQLEEVSLKNNKFTVIPYIAVPLIHLDLSRNKIAALNLTNALNVRNLDLSNNMLSTLSSQDMEMLSNVVELNINNNPLVCNDEFFELIDWSQKKGNKFSKRGIVYCIFTKGNVSFRLEVHKEIRGTDTAILSMNYPNSRIIPNEEISETPDSEILETTTQVNVGKHEEDETRPRNSASANFINWLLLSFCLFSSFLLYSNYNIH